MARTLWRQGDRSVTPDYYALLNVVPDADHDVIRAAYVVLAKRYHPDTATAASPQDVGKFQLIAEAYETLRDPDRRAHYDGLHARQRRILTQREKFEQARRRAREQDEQDRQGGRPRASSRPASALRNPLVFSAGGFAMGALVFGLMNTSPALHTKKFEPLPSLSGDTAAHDQRLADLLRALERTDRLAAGYRELLVQERARSRDLEEQLAARRDSTNPSQTADPMQASATDNAAPDPLPTSDKPMTPAADRPATVAARPAAPEVSGNPEASRLMARASLLLGQGNIGAARVVLERAAETGSPSALFALAETYDPVMLSAWGAVGTQGDLGKARDLYAKAFAGGVRKAEDRLNASR